MPGSKAAMQQGRQQGGKAARQTARQQCSKPGSKPRTRSADMAAKKGAPVYSLQPPMTPTLPACPLYDERPAGTCACAGGTQTHRAWADSDWWRCGIAVVVGAAVRVGGVASARALTAHAWQHRAQRRQQLLMRHVAGSGSGILHCLLQLLLLLLAHGAGAAACCPSEAARKSLRRCQACYWCDRRASGQRLRHAAPGASERRVTLVF